MEAPQSGQVKAFWIEPLEGRYQFELRRYRSGECPAGYKAFHNADVVIGEHGREDCKEFHEGQPVHGDLWPHEDARWPVKCDHCEYAFAETDEWQFNPNQLYHRADTGEKFTLRRAPIGAIWESPWMARYHGYCGPDGRSLHARCPGGDDWGIDSRASNCDSPCTHCGTAYHAHKGDLGHSYEDARPHKCWVRHGEPPELTVDKAGVTCGAGAGSIQTSNWHGFLRSGWFVP